MPEIESSEPDSNMTHASFESYSLQFLVLTTKIQIKPMGFDSMLKFLFIIELEN